MELTLLWCRIRVSMSQWHIPTQKFKDKSPKLFKMAPAKEMDGTKPLSLEPPS